MTEAHNMDIDPSDEETPQEEELSLDDLMEELNAELGSGKKEKKKKAAPVSYSGPTIVQVWHPNAAVLCVEQQHCACGRIMEHTIGTFIEDTTANGALRLQRVDAIPETHKKLMHYLRLEVTEITCCSKCFHA